MDNPPPETQCLASCKAWNLLKTRFRGILLNFLYLSSPQVRHTVPEVQSRTVIYTSIKLFTRNDRALYIFSYVDGKLFGWGRMKLARIYKHLPNASLLKPGYDENYENRMARACLIECLEKSYHLSNILGHRVFRRVCQLNVTEKLLS